MVWGSTLARNQRAAECVPLIILLRPDAGLPERSSVRAALDELKLVVEETRLVDRIAFLVTGGDTSWPVDSLARIPGVDKVVPLARDTSLVSGTYDEKGIGRTISVGSARFGGGQVGLIAGPCTVESPEALLQIGQSVRASGAAALRGGAFKVRTSPHSYQGGGPTALAELAAVAREVGLPFFTELNDPRQVAEVVDVMDAIQIGARHMQNFPLLKEAAATGMPILLKRHMAADVKEWLLAAEYILQAGNDQVILCERGIKTADQHVRFMLDVGVIPYLKQRVGLPVVVDPSHAAGDWRLVAPLARAAIAAGADGLLVEVHPRPETTRCDASQALPTTDFETLAQDVRQLLALDGRQLCEPRAGPSSSSCNAVGA
ncbi:MAG: 3-deoxy-7-phosphoheptulonate synthase [Pseudohongiellaceae bacterium]|jgi:3-deoxy-7-phosphoheptulonate synthase